MTRQVIRIAVSACLMIVALVVVSAAWADPQKEPPETKKDKPETGADDADEQYRREAEALVSGIELEALVGDKWVKVKRIEKPLLYFGDPTRSNNRGSVWGWGDRGRPLALLELHQRENDRAKWVYGICNTSGGKLRAKRGGAAWWQENDSAAELKDIPGAPAPAADAPQRARQLKQLAAKFTGHQFWDPNNSRFELRRLDRPLHTYRDEDAGLLEGALYTLANGTNPEIMVFVEARANAKDGSKAVWQYAVGRLADAELHLEYDGKEVFDAPRGNKVLGAAKPYWSGVITTTPDAKPDK
ncbi:MAG TPA: hypothetical protein VKE74_03500 [Gemmataceae bacterium]|nr:hypothetical protein [Gemmataceae bacterium]